MNVESLSSLSQPIVLHFGPVLQKLNDHEFFELCQLNLEWRIERTSEGDLVIMARNMSDDEVQALLETSSDPRDKAAIMLVFSAGLRISELSSLTWDDVIDDAENPIKLHVTDTNAATRQVLVERRLWNKYVAPLFFSNLEGGAAGCTSTPAEPRIFPVVGQLIQQIAETRYKAVSEA